MLNFVNVYIRKIKCIKVSTLARLYTVHDYRAFSQGLKSILLENDNL